jgi:hypothetical protein
MDEKGLEARQRLKKILEKKTSPSKYVLEVSNPVHFSFNYSGSRLIITASN